MSNKPERVFQHGGVKAAIFVNEHEKDGESFTRESISVQRVYRDKEGAFKTTKAFDYLTVRHEPDDALTSY
jgi:hypothetical protein